MREKIVRQQYDEEYSLFHIQHTDVVDCVFAGPADGESVLKEARDIGTNQCSFSQRYPLWYVKFFSSFSYCLE